MFRIESPEVFFMSALAPILLSSLMTGTAPTSDANIACNKTFSPEGWKQGNVASWVDRSGGIPLGYPRITYSLRPPTKESRVYKVSTKLYLPVLETVDPATGIFGPKLAYELQHHCDSIIPERATQAERNLFLSLLTGLPLFSIAASDGTPTDIIGSPMRAGIKDLEDVY
jgi:hypothetical protein